ncbi:unnamed protein product [Rhizopus stolonifer]
MTQERLFRLTKNNELQQIRNEEDTSILNDIIENEKDVLISTDRVIVLECRSTDSLSFRTDTAKIFNFPLCLTTAGNGKLQNAENTHQLREESLKNVGIIIKKNQVTLYMSKEVPYLINLNKDPLISECLMYNVKQNITHMNHFTEEGKQSTTRPNINDDHRYFDHSNGLVTLISISSWMALVFLDSTIQKKQRKSMRFTNQDLYRLYNEVAKVHVLRKRQSTGSDTLSCQTSPSSVFMDDDGYYTTDSGASILSLSEDNLNHLDSKKNPRNTNIIAENTKPSYAFCLTNTKGHIIDSPPNSADTDLKITILSV